MQRNVHLLEMWTREIYTTFQTTFQGQPGVPPKKGCLYGASESLSVKVNLGIGGWSGKKYRMLFSTVIPWVLNRPKFCFKSS